MRLTEEQKNKVRELLGSKSITPPICPVCTSSLWGISDTVFELREFQGGAFVLTGDSHIYPVVPLTCDNCGNTYFINAMKLGIIEQRSNSKGDTDNE